VQITHMAFAVNVFFSSRAFLHVQAGADPLLQAHLVDRAVHHDVVIGHVEMAVIVDPLRFDLHTEDRKGAACSVISRMSRAARRGSGSPVCSVWSLDPLYTFATVV